MVFVAAVFARRAEMCSEDVMCDLDGRDSERKLVA